MQKSRLKFVEWVGFIFIDSPSFSPFQMTFFTLIFTAYDLLEIEHYFTHNMRTNTSIGMHLVLKQTISDDQFLIKINC